MIFHSKTAQICYPYQRLVRALLVLVLLLTIGYVYCVSQVIFSAIAREKLAQQITTRESRVAELESRYVALSGRVTLNLARSLGFTDGPSETGFAFESARSWNENL